MQQVVTAAEERLVLRGGVLLRPPELGAVHLVPDHDVVDRRVVLEQAADERAELGARRGRLRRVGGPAAVDGQHRSSVRGPLDRALDVLRLDSGDVVLPREPDHGDPLHGRAEVGDSAGYGRVAVPFAEVVVDPEQQPGPGRGGSRERKRGRSRSDQEETAHPD